jgi:NADPH:quinone reductase-like Zn-dependent oxidoreductase/acyl carrier protein
VVLQASASGVLDDLRWVPLRRRPLEDHEVEIEVQASGLAFRDVMNALAMRRDSDPLGSEVSGIVRAVGSAVAHVAAGDAVVALATGGLASHVIADGALVVRRPRHLSAEQAVTLPTVGVTAYHALRNIARLKPGERVLIHAAAGGVGLAAVQIATRCGAVVLATAGSRAKRAFLRSLGVAHVFSSRSLDFAAAVREATNGHGVDVVLNSLSGEFIPASLDLLAPNGRFLEIGKRDIWSAADVGRRRADVSYHVIDLASGGTESKDTLAQVFRELIALADRGDLEPLPLRTYPWHSAAAAFRDMAQARHIGKIVVTPPHAAPSGALLRDDASYLVTGGLSGLGLLTAGWLAENGARHLILIGRREPSDSARQAIAAMQARGVEVVAAQCDVANAGELRELLSGAARTLPPLRGVVHSAGVLDDGVLLRQEWPRFARVLAPKVDGAWNLHALTLNKPLDFFVLYSSLAGLMGSSGQANHAAANSFIDALAHQRRRRGWPALSIDWGVWSDIGAAVERHAVEWFGKQGVATISPQRGLEVLGLLMREQRTQVAVLPVDWAKYLRQFRAGAPAWLSAIDVQRQARTAEPARAPVQAPPAAGTDGTLLEHLGQAPAEQRRLVAERHISEQVARVIGMDRSRAIDPDQPLSEMGLDSLMAVELRNRLGTTLGVERSLPATLVFDYPTIASIAQYLLRDVFAMEEAPERQDRARAPAGGAEDLLAAIEGLSDETAESLASREA